MTTSHRAPAFSLQLGKENRQLGHTLWTQSNQLLYCATADVFGHRMTKMAGCGTRAAPPERCKEESNPMTKAKRKKWSNQLFAGVWGAALAVLLVAVIIANAVALNYSTIITTFFGHTTSRVENGDPTAIYYESVYTTDGELYQAGLDLCEQVEAEGLVLLKNENNALPLGDGRKVSLFSESSVDLIYGGTGSGSVDTSTAKDLKTVFEDVGYEVNPELWNFYKGNHDSYTRSNPSIFASRNNFAINECPAGEYSQAVKDSFARYGDAAIVVLARSGGEGDDLSRRMDEREGGGTYLQLTTQEKEMLQLIRDSGAFGKTIVLVNSCNAMELGFLDEARYGIDACIWMGAAGQNGLAAVAAAVKGDVNPSGRLVDTYAYDSLSAPAMQNFGGLEYTNGSELDNLSESYFGVMTQYTGKNYVVYQEGIYVGYRYYETRYEDAVLGQGNAGSYDYAATVQYPFGYGLSYTDFSYSNFRCVPEGDRFILSLDVENTGSVPGKEVVQLYFQSPYTDYDRQNGIEKSSVELCGFAKTGVLAPGQSETVQVEVSREELRAYDANTAKTYILDAGDYYFAAGKNVHDALNNILASKGLTTADGMDADGDAALAAKWNQPTLDTVSYSAAATGTAITNQFDNADIRHYYGDLTYLTRSDWTGTFPETITLTATEALKADLAAGPDTGEEGYTMPNMGAGTDLTLAMMIGKSYDDPQWEELLDQLTADEMVRLVALGGYRTSQINSVSYLGTTDKDGPAGISATLVGGGTKCMAYPAEVVMAATWNVGLIREVGRLIGEDGLHGGVTGWYAPAMNTHRTPYSGRNFEYYSEDGFLAGAMGAAEVSGVQEKGVFCYIKHFAINDQETNRKGVATFSNEQAIREIYLTPFEYSVRFGGARAVMTSHNRIGATWAAGHAVLLNDVLRGEWGFVGHVVTDYVGTPVYQSALQAVLAGNDMMLSTSEANENISPYKNNARVMTALRQACKNILYTGANSAAMNGVSTSTRIVSVLPTWQIWLILFDCLMGAAIIAGGAGIFLRCRKSRSAADTAARR
ncbi:glycosyl hydrolase, partial [Pseudoflavonifractor sp. BIOML-A15]|nr:glycosyl hydrolase [Pseudoflavonifractor sp. BIOML-A15]MTR14600.1 glycosyl hydrolase [Pseudoflavonifractor sp. BIOML-A17]MTS65376.1 glycosyl hydrolase [Pseudoflavonifractor sp. BIOML-A5]